MLSQRPVVSMTTHLIFTQYFPIFLLNINENVSFPYFSLQSPLKNWSKHPVLQLGEYTIFT